MMFTDEEIFNKNSYFNPENDVIWTDDRSDASEHGRLHSMEKYPVCVMVVVDATPYGLMHPYFFLKSERLNGQSYHDYSCYHFIKRKANGCSDQR